MIARITAAFGRQLYLRTDASEDRVAVTRGRRQEAAVGDRVRCTDLGGGQAVIEAVLERRNLILRSDEHRQKVIAANVDQVALVIGADPPYDEELLLRAMVAVETERADCIVLATKSDLPDAIARMEPRLALFARLGYPVFRLSVRRDPAAAIATLAPRLRDRTTLLMGESGMGKSTLVNALVPQAEQRTRAISDALRAGRHTTTFTRAFELPSAIGGDGWLIDSPGYQTFGLAHLSESQRMHGLREFAPLLGRCRFHNCRHAQEPGCAIREAAERGEIDPLRYRLYLRL